MRLAKTDEVNEARNHFAREIYNKYGSPVNRRQLEDFCEEHGYKWPSWILLARLLHGFVPVSWCQPQRTTRKKARRSARSLPRQSCVTRPNLSAQQGSRLRRSKSAHRSW